MPVRLGDATPTDFRLGDTEVSRLYMGDALAWERTALPVAPVASWIFSPGASSQYLYGNPGTPDMLFGPTASIENNDPQWATAAPLDRLIFDGVDDFAKIASIPSVTSLTRPVVELVVLVPTQPTGGLPNLVGIGNNDGAGGLSNHGYIQMNPSNSTFQITTIRASDGATIQGAFTFANYPFGTWTHILALFGSQQTWLNSATTFGNSFLTSTGYVNDVPIMLGANPTATSYQRPAGCQVAAFAVYDGANTSFWNNLTTSNNTVAQIYAHRKGTLAQKGINLP